MTNAYTYQQISNAVNAGASLVIDEFGLGERDEDVINIVVNAAMTLLENPDADMEKVAEECYSEPLQAIKVWWDF